MSEHRNLPTTAIAVVAPLSRSEHRRSHRAKVSLPVRVRPADPKYVEEVQTTLNATRDGLYFTTSLKHYYLGMQVQVTFPYRPTDRVNSEYIGRVVRLDRLAGGRWGVAIHFLLR